MQIEWAILIKKYKEEIKEKCWQAFEKAMEDKDDNHQNTYAVILKEDGTTRINKLNDTVDKESDVHYCKSITITTFEFNPNWEEDLYNSCKVNERKNLYTIKSEKERGVYLKKYEKWYESKEFIEKRISLLYDKLMR